MNRPVPLAVIRHKYQIVSDLSASRMLNKSFLGEFEWCQKKVYNQGHRMTWVVFGMPVYNGERCIAAHLQAFLDQTFEDFKVIVGDNASTDGTEDIFREFASRTLASDTSAAITTSVLSRT